MTAPPLLELEGISKRFQSVVASDGVTFSLGAKEIHALLGENGAGKSTLVKMIYGIMRPDEGVMRFAGKPYAPHKPSEARDKGIGVVFQHFSLFEGLTVAENIALGISAKLAKSDLRERILRVSRAYGLALDPDSLVGMLSVGERQRVEIMRCLMQEPQLLIMDEPTSVLTPQEVKVLFSTLRRLVCEGRSILYISHKLEEIRSLCDRATILRGGKVVGRCDPRRETARSLAEMMIGAMPAAAAREGRQAGPTRLKVGGLTLKSDEQFGVDLKDIAFEVRGGEILGIAGVAGNGQVELMEVLIGERRAGRSEVVEIDGAAVGMSGPSARRALGMCFVPEERLGHGSVADMSLWENAVLTAKVRMKLTRFGLVGVARARAFAGRVVDELAVHAGGVDSAARSLSGGNLQKFIVGREMLQTPSVLIASQPTWGVDVGAAATIHGLLRELARAGVAILIISQDLDELLAIATRIAVIANGRLIEAKPVDQLTAASLGLSMAGHGGSEPSHA